MTQLSSKSAAKSKHSIKRPLVVTGLSCLMIVSSLFLTYTRLQNLRSLPSLSPFVETIRNQDLGLPIEEITVNVAFFSNIAILSTSFIPLVLGIGLWNLYSWARTISVCLLASLLIPNILAALGMISDRGATVSANISISIACSVGLLILLHPQIVSIFRIKRITSHQK
jgi:hypothetical protein